MVSKVVQLRTEYNGVVNYTRFGARVPEFLQKYPLQEFRVETSVTDLLSLQSGRLALLKEAVAAGKKPADVGLPGIENDVNTLVCTVTLLDSQNRVVRQARASAPILFAKDFEKLETAAHQRLLGLLGHGGEVFDEDENRDFEDAGVTPVGGGSSEPQLPRTETLSKQSDTSQSTPDSKPSTASSGDAPIALLRQLEKLAQRLGEPAPKVTGAEEAKRELARMGQLEGERRRAATR